MMFKHIRIAFVSTLLALSAASCPAEPVTDQQVLDTVNLYMQSMRDGDYDTMSQLMHPGELQQLKDLYLLIAEGAAEDGRLEELGQILGGVRSLDDLRRMPPEVFFSRLMASLTRLVPDLGRILESAKVTILGQVREGEEDPLLHIVYRLEMQMEDTTIRSVAVSSLKQGEDGRYYFLIDEKARGIVEALKKQFVD